MSAIALLYPEAPDMARFREGRKEFPPFGVLYLAAAAEAAGHRVELHAVARDEGPLDLREFDVIGFSLASSATYGTMLRCRRDALLSDSALTLVGGVHANFYPEASLREFAVDAVAENTDEDIFLRCLDCTGSPERLAAIPGMWTRGSEGEPVAPATASVLRKGRLEELPFPARHLLPVDDVIMSDRLAGTDLRMAHIMLSRGCPFPCNFCAAARGTFQWRSGASARAELVHLKETYGIEGFAIVDDNFIINRKVVREVCEHIADLGLKWSALSRVDAVDRDLLQVMKDAGCIELKFGVESGSARILHRMNKGAGVNPDVIKAAIRAAAGVGIGVKAFVIHGFPGEDHDSTTETIALLDELAPCIDRVAVFRFVPLPGTYVFRNPAEFALRGVTADGPANGRWETFHIHHNDAHWWGTQEQFDEVCAAHARLTTFVAARWPDAHAMTVA